MQQASFVNDSGEASRPSRRGTWISTAVAIFAIGAAAVLCFGSFAEADKSMERLHAPSTQTTKASAGSR